MIRSTLIALFVLATPMTAGALSIVLSPDYEASGATKFGLYPDAHDLLGCEAWQSFDAAGRCTTPVVPRYDEQGIPMHQPQSEYPVVPFTSLYR